MDFVFIHRNFPAQFRYLATALAADNQHRVFAIGSQSAARLPGVKLSKYQIGTDRSPEVHPFAREFDMECRRAEQVLYGATALKSAGLRPDFVFSHSAWGEGLALRDLFPESKLISYCEFYRRAGTEFGFDPEFPALGVDGQVLLRATNAANLLALCDADVGLAPTHWQRGLFPTEFHGKIEVIHDGIDTDVFKANAKAKFTPDNDAILRVGDEVISFVAPNLEPYRGFHVFMRALPRILAARPKAHVVIVGGDSVSHGASPPSGQTWKRIFLDEIRDRVDVERISFIQGLPYSDYLALLQVSRIHVYLTYPFVLSRSLLEAMACECLVVASDTSPVQEVVENQTDGLLVPFFDSEALAQTVIEASAEYKQHLQLRRRARRRIVENYDFKTVCLAQHLKLLGLPAAEQPLKLAKKIVRTRKPVAS